MPFLMIILGQRLGLDMVPTLSPSPLPPHLPFQGLSLLDKKPFATASSPILARRSLICSSLIFGTFFAAARRYAGCTFQKPALPTMDHRRVNAKLVCHLSDHLFTFSASSTTCALTSGQWLFRFNISDAFPVEYQQTTNCSLR